MSKKVKFLSLLTIVVTVSLVGVLSFSHPAKAADEGCKESNYQDYANCTGSLVPDFSKSACLRVLPPCFKCGDCQLDDFVWLFVNMGTWGIRILPVAALLFLIWGAVNLLISAGNQEKIQMGKKMIASVLIGVVIVLVVAWIMTGFIVWLLTGDASGKIFNRPWYGTGAGEEGGKPSAGQGCCITSIGCHEGLTEEQCDTDYKELKQGWEEGKSCTTDLKTICENLEVGWPDQCCVPNNANDPNCQPPLPKTVCNSYGSNYTLKNQSCTSIVQCLDIIKEITSGCCVSDTGDCDKPVGIGTCGPGFSFRSESCETIGSCKGCCYNGASPNPDQCQNDTVRYNCSFTAWERGFCTPRMCGKTCCTNRCGAATPDVPLTNCAAEFQNGDANGRCTSEQLESYCCKVPPTCYDNMNFKYAQVIDPGGYDCDITGAKCANTTTVNCAPPVVIVNCL